MTGLERKRENTANDDQKSCCFHKEREGMDRNKKEKEGEKKGQRIK